LPASLSSQYTSDYTSISSWQLCILNGLPLGEKDEDFVESLVRRSQGDQMSKRVSQSSRFKHYTTTSARNLGLQA
jgi:hypothetical protein